MNNDVRSYSHFMYTQQGHRSVADKVYHVYVAVQIAPTLAKSLPVTVLTWASDNSYILIILTCQGERSCMVTNILDQLQ